MCNYKINMELFSYIIHIDQAEFIWYHTYKIYILRTHNFFVVKNSNTWINLNNEVFTYYNNNDCSIYFDIIQGIFIRK